MIILGCGGLARNIARQSGCRPTMEAKALDMFGGVILGMCPCRAQIVLAGSVVYDPVLGAMTSVAMLCALQGARG